LLKEGYTKMKATLKSTLTLSIILGAMAWQLPAQATRTWISGVGDDVNPCSRTAPCKTFAGAIAKTAAGGEIDALDPGGFGALTITKAITLDGGSGIVASVLASGVNGIVIAAGATDTVVLRNLQINGAGTAAGTDTRGVKFLSGAQLVVENCDISRMGKRGISIESSTPGAVASIINSTVHDNLVNGIIVSPPAGIANHVVLHNVRAVNNLFYGLGTTAGATVEILGSTLSNNVGGGILTDNSIVELQGSMVSGNGIGITSQNGGIVRLGGTTVSGNTTTLTISAGTIASYGDNYFAGGAFGLTSVSKQ
jgi:hypothetical protein